LPAILAAAFTAPPNGLPCGASTSPLAQQEHRLVVARTALEHARACPAKDPSCCPRFWAIIDARLSGESLEARHAAMH